MPEGHTVHRLARAFDLAFTGHVLSASSPQGRFEAGAAVIDRKRLSAVEAHGKQMFLHFGRDRFLRVHLGMYGMWRFAGPGLEGYGRRTRRDPDADPTAIPKPRGEVRLRLLRGRTHAADLSGPTACEILDAAGRSAAMAKLGEDPLRTDSDPDRAYATVSKSRQPIAAMLMRQDVVAGIGNIYRAEILFRARIDPYLASRDLPKTAWHDLWDDLATLMRRGVEDGKIVTVDRRKSHAKADGEAGRRGHRTWVAHRAGKPCAVCGTEIRAAPMAGRRLFWCPECQAPKA